MANNEVSKAKTLDNLKKDPNFIKYLELLKKDSIWIIQKNLRAELPHTNFIAWLLDPKESHGLGFEPISLFLKSIVWICNGDGREDNLVNANKEISQEEKTKENINIIKDIINEDNVTRRNYIKDVNVYTDKSGNVETRALLYKYRDSAYGDKSDLDDATIDNYTNQNKLAKLDLFIEVTYQLPNEKENTLNIIIENKTKSKETKTDVEQITGTGVEKRSIGQTIKYEVWADNEKLKGDIIFIHWTPNSDYQLTTIEDNKNLEFKCESKKYIKYNYQTFESKVIERIGVLKSNDSLKTHYILEDYKNCLSFNINADPYILAHPLAEYDLAYELLEDKGIQSLFAIIYSSEEEEYRVFRNSDEYRGFLLSFAETCLSSYRPDMKTRVKKIGEDNLKKYYEGSEKGSANYSLVFGDVNVLGHKEEKPRYHVEAARSIIKYTVSKMTKKKAYRSFVDNYIGIVIGEEVCCKNDSLKNEIVKIKNCKNKKHIKEYKDHKNASCLYSGDKDFYVNGGIEDEDKKLMDNIVKKCEKAFSEEGLNYNKIFIPGKHNEDTIDQLIEEANKALNGNDKILKI